MRTSSATNVGADKDSEKRQRISIEAFAKARGLEIVDWFYDPAVSGADPIEVRPGFSALLDRIEGNGVRTVVVEDASRFARDLVAQELGLLLLIKRDVRVLTVSGDDLTDTSDPSRVMMRQIAGSFAQYEKTRLVTSSGVPVSAYGKPTASARAASRSQSVSPSWFLQPSACIAGRPKDTVGHSGRSQGNFRRWATATSTASPIQRLASSRWWKGPRRRQRETSAAGHPRVRDIAADLHRRFGPGARQSNQRLLLF
jgi:hypothetical protein